MDDQTHIPITLFLNQLSDAIIICDKLLRITRWNETATLIYGWTAVEALGQHIDDLLGTRWNKTPQAHAIAELVKTGSWHGELQQRTKDGRLRQIWSAVSWLKNTEGEIIGGMTINRDITEEMASRKALDAQKEHQRLEGILKNEQEWNKTVQHMMKVLFHDMRVPLAVINTSSGLLNRHYDKYTPQQRLEKLETVYAQVRHMNQMMDDASFSIRGSLTHRVFHARRFNLTQLCEVCVKEIQDALATCHTLTFETDGLVQHVELDETLISRILVNLLSNAIKYSPNCGNINLILRQQDDQIIIQVSDSGMGISPEDQTHIFESSFRSGQVNNISGTGLGLSIVRECVEVHRGTILVESELGKGTTFTVCLPFVDVSQAEVRV